MKLQEILAIAGQPGLYKYVAQASRGLIIESLKDGKRSNVAGHSNVSALSEISMFTEGEDIALAKVFTRLYALTEGKESISHKESVDTIKAEFEKILPEYDRDRVHVSDMKKCFAWFNILIGAGATSFEIEGEEPQAEEAEQPAE